MNPTLGGQLISDAQPDKNRLGSTKGRSAGKLTLKKIGRGASAIFFANVLYAGFQWLLLILIAKLKDPTAVGEFSYLIAVTSPLVLLSGLQLKTVLVTDQSRRFAFGDYVALRLFTAVLMVLGIAAYGQYAPGEEGGYSALCLMAIAKGIESISDLLHGVFLKHGTARTVCVSMLLRGVLSTTLFIGALLWLNSMSASIAGLALGYLATLLFFDLPKCLLILRLATPVIVNSATSQQPGDFAEAAIRPRYRRLTEMVFIGLPLGLTVALNSATSNIPRYFLEWHLGMYEVGVFSAIAMALRLGFYVENALNQAALPSLSAAFASHDRTGFVRTTKTLLACCFLMLVVGTFISIEFGSVLLTLVYNKEYSEHYLSLTILMIAQGVAYHAGVLKTAIDATGRFNIQVPLFILSSASALVSAFFLVPRYGISGAAMSMLSPRIVLVIGYSFLFSRVLNEQMKEQPA